MSSIIRTGNTYHGISVFGRGVFTNDEHGGRTYAGQHRDGYARGLGVATWSCGSKEYAEHGPDGKYDGRFLGRWANGDTYYYLFERGKRKEYARVFADGRCEYDSVVCATDDPRLLALIAHVGPVEVRRAAPASPPPAIALPLAPLAPKQSSDVPARFATGAREDHGLRGASPRHTPSLVVARHNPTAAAMHSPTTHSERTGLARAARPLSPSRTLPPSFIAYCAQHGPIQAASLLCDAHAVPSTPPNPVALQFSESGSVLAGGGSRGQPADALGGACALRTPSVRPARRVYTGT
jgi:hypothetical protein